MTFSRPLLAALATALILPSCALAADDDRRAYLGLNLSLVPGIGEFSHDVYNTIEVDADPGVQVGAQFGMIFNRDRQVGFTFEVGPEYSSRSGSKDGFEAEESLIGLHAAVGPSYRADDLVLAVLFRFGGGFASSTVEGGGNSLDADGSYYTLGGEVAVMYRTSANLHLGLRIGFDSTNAVLEDDNGDTEWLDGERGLVLGIVIGGAL